MTALAELNLWRRAHRGAAARALAVWKLVEGLRDCTVLFPYEATLTYLANAVFSNAGYDASERYSDEDEFAEALGEDLENAMPERCDVDGISHLVLRPVFNENSRFYTELKLGYLHGYCRVSELAALNVAALPHIGNCAEGLSEEELSALVAYHRGKATKLANALRHLRTSYHYLEKGVAEAIEPKYSSGRPKAIVDKRIAGYLAELLPLIDLPFTPAPCGHFGTEADRINPLRSLESDETLLKPLLDWA